MITGESTSKGGRPPYVLEEEDIQLAERLAKHGYSKKSIAAALGINETTLYEILARNEAFSKCIKKGVAEHCANAEDRVLDGNLAPTQYIYWSKTKWKNFYPQEDKQVESKVNIQLTDEQALQIQEIARNGASK